MDRFKATGFVSATDEGLASVYRNNSLKLKIDVVGIALFGDYSEVESRYQRMRGGKKVHLFAEKFAKFPEHANDETV